MQVIAQAQECRMGCCSGVLHGWGIHNGGKGLKGENESDLGKCWTPSDIENKFQREKWRHNMSEQRVGCAQDWADERRWVRQQTSDRRCDQRQRTNAEGQAEG